MKKKSTPKIEAVEIPASDLLVLGQITITGLATHALKDAEQSKWDLLHTHRSTKHHPTGTAGSRLTTRKGVKLVIITSADRSTTTIQTEGEDQQTLASPPDAPPRSQAARPVTPGTVPPKPPA